MATFIVGAMAALAICNCWLTAKLLRAGDLTYGQKLIQLGMVWFIPILGAVFVGGVRKSVANPGRPEVGQGCTGPWDGVPPGAGPTDGLPD